jgi:plastocyanin
MKILQGFAKKQVVTLVAVLLVASLVSFAAIYTLSVKNKHSPVNAGVCKDTCVGLYEDKASPNTLAVAVGSYVQFNSKDGKTHDLSLGDATAGHQHTGNYQSGEFKGDEGWRVQFNSEGTYTFHDHYNTKISIVVVVYTPGKDYKVQ